LLELDLALGGPHRQHERHENPRFFVQHLPQIERREPAASRFRNEARARPRRRSREKPPQARSYVFQRRRQHLAPGDVDHAMIGARARPREKPERRRCSRVVRRAHHQFCSNAVADDGIGRRGRLDRDVHERRVERGRGLHLLVLGGELRRVRPIDERAARALVRVLAMRLIFHARYTSEGAKRPPSRRSFGAGSWSRRNVRL
jgi:hypothetical protein